MHEMSDGELSLSRIGQIAVRVKDLERAIAFYRDALGMKFLFQAPPGLAFFSCGDVRLLLDMPLDKEFDHPSSVIYFTVPDVKKAHETLSARGVPFFSGPHIVHRAETYELWMAFFRDPDENVHAIMAEVPLRN